MQLPVPDTAFVAGTCRGSLVVVQGLGKTVTTIALLVSNNVEPDREWGRVQVDLNAPKRKRLKWEQQKPDRNGVPAYGAMPGEPGHAVGASGSGGAREQQEGLGVKPSDSMQAVMDADAQKMVRFYSAAVPFIPVPEIKKRLADSLVLQGRLSRSPCRHLLRGAGQT